MCVVPADDLTTHPSGEEVTVAGLHSILPKEHGNRFYELTVLHHHDKDVSAVASWDSSIHDSQYLNRITEGILLSPLQKYIHVHRDF
jgi:kinesin family member 13